MIPTMGAWLAATGAGAGAGAGVDLLKAVKAVKGLTELGWW